MMELPKLNFASHSDSNNQRSVKSQEAQRKKLKLNVEKGIASREADLQEMHDRIVNIYEADEGDTESIFQTLLNAEEKQKQIAILKHMHAQLF